MCEEQNFHEYPTEDDVYMCGHCKTSVHCLLQNMRLLVFMYCHNQNFASFACTIIYLFLFELQFLSLAVSSHSVWFQYFVPLVTTTNARSVHDISYRNTILVILQTLQYEWSTCFKTAFSAAVYSVLLTVQYLVLRTS